jgi:hypothetical protein
MRYASALALCLRHGRLLRESEHGAALEFPAPFGTHAPKRATLLRSGERAYLNDRYGRRTVAEALVPYLDETWFGRRGGVCLKVKSRWTAGRGTVRHAYFSAEVIDGLPHDKRLDQKAITGLPEWQPMIRAALESREVGPLVDWIREQLERQLPDYGAAC